MPTSIRTQDTRLGRRDFLKLSLAMAALASCSHNPNDGEITTTLPKPTPAQKLDPTQSPIPNLQSPLAWLATNRLTFGPRSGDVAHVDQMGVDAFIEEQLAYTQLDDSAMQTRLSQYAHLQDTLTQAPRDLASDKKREIVLDLQQATLLRAVYSQRQLYELMVDFWTNHFNIYLPKGAEAYLKPEHDREVIRPYALGKFRDLLGANAHSPAMLFYLDNQNNVKGEPNENFARELMELHAIGVDGGYTQHDVQEVARAFTGWSVKPPRNAKKTGNAMQPEGAGEFLFRAKLHDDDAKTLLGAQLAAGGGLADGERVLDTLAAHPNCATFISLKLCRRFVSDDPAASVVEKGAAAFKQTDGDIAATLGAILHSDAFKQSFGQKLKRPFEFTASALRALDVQSDCDGPVLQAMRQMGQPLFLWPAPNGYPDAQGAWLGASSLLARWNFGMALRSNATVSGNLDELASQILGGPLPQPVQDALKPFAKDTATLIALLISSPLFQVRG